jgi:hypothetical protein
VDLYEFKVSLVYRLSSRTVRAIHRETLSQKKKKKEYGGIYTLVILVAHHSVGVSE